MGNVTTPEIEALLAKAATCERFAHSAATATDRKTFHRLADTWRALALKECARQVRASVRDL